MIVVRLLMQTVVLALGQIWANKVRSMLTTLGIVIGVAAVVATVAAIEGLRGFVLAEFETFGATKVFIAGNVPQSKRGVMRWRDAALKIEELDAIERHAPSVTAITPHWFAASRVEYGQNAIESARVVGIRPQWHDIENRQVREGRPFNVLDEEQRRYALLINARAIEELNLPINPVGEYVLLAGRRFMIIGVVETLEISAMFGGGESRAEFFVPFSTAMILNPNAVISYALASMRSPQAAEDTRTEVDFVLRSMRGLDPEEDATFNVEIPQEYVDRFKALSAGLVAGAAGIVGISLLVGGIGIMNIMLVSVSERTREIGLRKAVGARPAVILVQFLTEAVVLCLMGGAVGIAIGQAIIVALKQIPNAPLEHASMPMWAVALAVGFCAVTGVVFGVFPAIKAARLDPIVALRHD
ncbi:MAG: ABC transporter permease [Phycisphaeraceae bacterium]|nr:ABC transporter permease [Phycisphaeraceae bacterium]